MNKSVPVLLLLLLCLMPGVSGAQGLGGGAPPQQVSAKKPEAAAPSIPAETSTSAPENLAAPVPASGSPVDLLALDPDTVAQMGIDADPKEEKKMDMNVGPSKRKPTLKPPSEKAMAEAKKTIPDSKIEVNQGTPDDVKEALQKFAGDFSFPLTEEKMISFARSAVMVDRINSKWDIEIAGAETDSMAIEYSNFAIEELENSLKSIKDLTREQYNELTGRTAQDRDFARMFSIYKQLVLNGAFGKAPVVNLDTGKDTASSYDSAYDAPVTKELQSRQLSPAAPMQSVGATGK